uniref:Radiation-inducible immediate-early gene IEX-1 n=1 Tax=Sinocyclocheilus grahami TaxID=75366 RepID=A0A672MIE8_SINGR
MCSACTKHPHSGLERFGDGEKPPLSSPSISPKPSRPHRPRARRVLYPPGLRKIMPKEESDPARRWLLLLSALLFLQIYMEEGSTLEENPFSQPPSEADVEGLCDTQGIPDRPQAQDDQSSTLEENPFSQPPSEADVAQCRGIEQSCNLYWEMRSCF